MLNSKIKERNDFLDKNSFKLSNKEIFYNTPCIKDVYVHIPDVKHLFQFSNPFNKEFYTENTLLYKLIEENSLFYIFIEYNKDYDQIEIAELLKSEYIINENNYLKERNL